jgi:hypothetical protein
MNNKKIKIKKKKKKKRKCRETGSGSRQCSLQRSDQSSLSQNGFNVQAPGGS